MNDCVTWRGESACSLRDKAQRGGAGISNRMNGLLAYSAGRRYLCHNRAWRDSSHDVFSSA